MSPTTIDHGQVYRFLCPADNRFLDLHMRTTDHGNKIQVWDGNCSNAQRFRAEVVDGGIRFLSQCRRKGEPLRVISEAADGSGLVVYADHCTDSNHLWEAQAHENENGPYVLIVNKGSGKALAHQGLQNQVRCINADSNDVWQQWHLMIAEHDLAGHTE